MADRHRHSDRRENGRDDLGELRMLESNLVSCGLIALMRVSSHGFHVNLDVCLSWERSVTSEVPRLPIDRECNRVIRCERNIYVSIHPRLHHIK